MHLISVNVGRPESIDVKGGKTGIFKRPMSGPVHVGTYGLAGDAICDTKHHGGRDQAVYLYGVTDYAWWSAGSQEGRCLGQAYVCAKKLEGTDDKWKTRKDKLRTALALGFPRILQDVEKD